MEDNLNGHNYQNFPSGDYDNSNSETYQSEANHAVGLGGDAEKWNEQVELVSAHGHEVSEASPPLFRHLIRWVVYAAAFLIPISFLPFTADVLEFNKQTLLVILAGVGLVAYLVDVIKSGVIRYRPSSLYLPIFGLVAASILSVIFSVNRVVSIFGAGENRTAALITLASLAVLFFLTVNSIEDHGKKLKNILTLSLTLALLFGVLQTFGIYVFSALGFTSRSFNSIGTLNMLGVIAAIGLAFFATSSSSYEKEEGSGKWLSMAAKWSSYLGLLLSLFFLVLINWWPIWTVAFVSLLASVAFSSAGDSSLVKTARMRLFAIPMAVIVLGIFLILINFAWTPIKSKLPVEVAPSQKTSWSIAFDSLKARPLGNGAGNFGIAYDKFKPSNIANSIFYQFRFTDGTSEAVNTAIEGGLPALLALLALLFFYGKELVAKVRNGFGGSKESTAVWAAGVGFVAAYFLYPFSVAALSTFFFMLALGAVMSADNREKLINLESDAKYSFIGSIAFIGGLVVALVAGYFTVNNYMAEAYTAKALKSKDRNDAVIYLTESINSNPNDTKTYRMLSQTLIAQIADDLKNGPRNGESRDNYNTRVQNQVASVVNIAVKATSINPADSQNWSNRGFVYENLLNLVGGADQAAVNTYNEALARNPADPNIHLRIGNVYLTLADNIQRALNNAKGQNVNYGAVRKQIEDNLAKAEESFKKAIALYNNFGQALYNLAVVYDRENKLPDAIKQFEKLRTTNQRDPSIAFQIGLLYYRNNQKNDALNAWQQAVLLFPNYSNARWYLSLAYEEKGDIDNALKQVQEIQKVNPNNDLVKQRIAELTAGKRTIPPDKVLDKQPLNQ